MTKHMRPNARSQSPFTLDELKIIAQLVQNSPVTGTLSTLPDLLVRMAKIREKIKVLLGEGATETTPADQSPKA